MQGADVRVDENQINDLIKRISDKEYKEDKEDKNLRYYVKYFLTNNEHNLSITYDKK